jgi:hypothetical protein
LRSILGGPISRSVLVGLTISQRTMPWMGGHFAEA